MSKGRGNRLQQQMFAAVRDVAEAAGLTCRLDCTQRSAEQHAIVELPRGGRLRIPLHGTPKVPEGAVRTVERRAVKLIKEALSKDAACAPRGLRRGAR